MDALFDYYWINVLLLWMHCLITIGLILLYLENVLYNLVCYYYNTSSSKNNNNKINNNNKYYFYYIKKINDKLLLFLLFLLFRHCSLKQK